ncbi:Flp pilus assembly protein CpaB [Trinickia sp. Y13]|uniref:Flp pilus assembly protein CpaB n=1 Tax=Trinickia sp. Y13 TaxID=2917807 RepID=UPI0024055B16|nr:Flp pilus assembly protein CpaB [Trinickia sp. Y13]MDG0025738.1 Flp pilus assembly protein CpaB [Trinickia sp. Y13]
MKNSRALIMLAVAMVTGLAAVVFASRWLIHTSSSALTPVAVARDDINLGQPLNVNMIRIVNWPTGSVPPGAFTDVKPLDGRVLRTSLARGEPVLETKLAPIGTKGGLSAVIEKGDRAITVRVNDVVGVAGFALPGNYVDVIVNTQEPGKGDQQSISKIVLEKILVLAVAQQVSRDDTQPKVVNAVTLQVSPDQAEKLDLARSVGTLSLVLRNQVDKDQLATNGATKLTLLGHPAPVAASAPVATTRVRYVAARPAPHAKRDCVGVLSGVTGSEECF